MVKLYDRLKWIPLLCSIAFTSGVASLNADIWQNPVQVFEPFNTGSTSLGVNPAGDAVATWAANDSVFASYFANDAWGPYVTLDTGSNFYSVNVALDDAGNALTIWEDGIAGTIHSAYFDISSGWFVPLPDPLDSGLGFCITALSMRPGGTGVGIWIDTDAVTSNVRTANFSGGSWTNPITIGSGSFGALSLAASANGTAVAAWDDTNTGIPVVANYIGGTWTTTTIPGFTSSIFEVGIDSNGRAILASLDATGNVVVRTFNGTVWSAPQTISTAGNNGTLSLAVARNGTAVLAWVDSANQGLSSSFNGTAWSLPFPFTDTLVSSGDQTIDVSIDTKGNALIIWATESFDALLSARLPRNAGVWSPSSTIQTDLLGIRDVMSGLADNQRGFAEWTFPGEGSPTFGAFTLFGAEDIFGCVCDNNFASQTDRVHAITWIPSEDPIIVNYYIRRNGIIIAVIPSTGPFTYYDHNRSKKVSDVYTVTGVDALGNETTPLTVTLR